MSIVAKLNEEKKTALRKYRDTKQELYKQEIAAMNAALEVCLMKDSDGNPVYRTADEIARAAGHELSCNEVAGNLLAMNGGVSRHQCWEAERIMGFNNRASRNISVKYGGHKTLRMAQVDDNGNLIPGTETYIRRSLPNTYTVNLPDEKPDKPSKTRR